MACGPGLGVLIGAPSITKTPELPYGVRLRVAYDGTEFHGWQAQKSGIRTVQGELDKALASMGFRCGASRGASRTDRGVHAEGQVVGFATEKELPMHGWRIGLNGHLPPDISVVEAAPCHRLYNPRFDAARKLYRYRVVVGEVRDPLTNRFGWQFGPRTARRDVPRVERQERVRDYLDLDAMQDAANRMLGRHDFQAFRAYDDGRMHTERGLSRVEMVETFGGRERELAIEVEGDGFMKNMVRIIVGTLTDIGRQRLQPSVIDDMLSPDGTRSLGGPTAPPQGLSLVKIWLKLGDHKRAFRP